MTTTSHAAQPQHAILTSSTRRYRKAALLSASALISIAATPAFAQTYITSPRTVDSTTPLNDTVIFIGHTPSSLGSLTIESGGQVTTNTAEVGGAANSRGFITIRDAGSSWTSTGLLTLADGGEAVMRVLGGSATTNGVDIAAIGQGPGGRIVVDNAAGAGSTWQNTGLLAVGKFDTGEVLIQNNGVFNNIGNVIVANSVNSSGSKIDVTSGGVFNITGDSTLTLGNNRTGFLNINTGGVVDIAGAGTFVSGVASSSRSNAITVENAGSSLSVETFTLAEAGQSELNINDGGAVNVSGVFSMATVAGSQATANLDGANTKLTATGGATLGNDGSASMTIRNGAVFEAGASTTLGAFTGSSVNTGNGTVAVIGSGSAFNVTSGDLTLGLNGDGEIRIINGATVDVQGDAKLGVNSNSTGVISMSGGSAAFSTGGALTLGEAGGSGEFIVSNGADATIGGDLVSASVGAGVVTVQGVSSTLQAGGGFSAGGSGVSTVNVLDGGSITIAAGTSFSSSTSGTGSIRIDGANSVFHSQSGQLRVGSAGTVTADVTNGGRLRGDRAEVGTAAGSSGEVNVVGENSLFQANRFTIAEAGSASVRLAEGGRLRADVRNPGAVRLANRSTGDATLIIGGEAGDTPTEAGVVDAIDVTLGNGDAEIVFNHTDTDYIFDASVLTDRAGSTPGSSSHTINIYSGATTMTGIWDIEGDTTVHGGRLNVNGEIVGNLNVLGGEIGGSGKLSGLSLPSGATLAPGNSIGTMTIANDLSFNDDSSLEIEVNDAGASDLVDVGGAVTIGNNVGLEVLPENGTDDGSTYNESTAYTFIRAAGGITGEFATVTESFAFLDAEVTIENGEATLTLVRATNPGGGGDGGNGGDGGGGNPDIIEFEDVAVSPNQRSIARSLEALGAGSELYDVVVGLSEAQARTAFDQLSGEVHASALASVMQDSRIIRDVATDRLRDASDEDGLSIWASAYGSWGTWDESGDNTAAELDRSTAGFVFGADFPLFSALRLGALLGVAGGDVEIDARGSEADIGTFHFGAYADWDVFKAMTIRAGLLNSWNDLETERAVDIRGFNSFSDRLTAEYNANVFQFFAEAAYAFDLGRFNVEPYAGLAYASLDVDDVTERGGSARLTSAEYDMDTAFSTIGMRADYAFEMFGANAALEGGLAWRHAFDDTLPRQSFRFANAGAADGRTFTTEGVPLAEDAAIIDLGLSFPLAKRIGAGLGYNGQFGNGVSDHGIRANLSFSF